MCLGVLGSSSWLRVVVQTHCSLVEAWGGLGGWGEGEKGGEGEEGDEITIVSGEEDVGSPNPAPGPLSLSIRSTCNFLTTQSKTAINQSQGKDQWKETANHRGGGGGEEKC